MAESKTPSNDLGEEIDGFSKQVLKEEANRGISNPAGDSVDRELGIESRNPAFAPASFGDRQVGATRPHEWRGDLPTEGSAQQERDGSDANESESRRPS